MLYLNLLLSHSQALSSFIVWVDLWATVTHALGLLEQLHRGTNPHAMDMANLELSATAAQSSGLLKLPQDLQPHDKSGFAAAWQASAFHGHGGFGALNHCSICKWPPPAAARQVSDAHSSGGWWHRAHSNTSWLPSAAPYYPETVMLQRKFSIL
jgi:hypothetical protein